MCQAFYRGYQALTHSQFEKHQVTLQWLLTPQPMAYLDLYQQHAQLRMSTVQVHGDIRADRMIRNHDQACHSIFGRVMHPTSRRNKDIFSPLITTRMYASKP